MALPSWPQKFPSPIIIQNVSVRPDPQATAASPSTSSEFTLQLTFSPKVPSCVMQISRILSGLAVLLHAATAAAASTNSTADYVLSAAGTATGLPGGNSACGGKRIRKSWSSLSSEEQSLYLEAVGKAIDNGVVSELAAIHIEDMGEKQAHHSCAFFMWHRRMLLAYESYLRDLDPKYACVTIPYYDVHSAYVKAANKQCTSMYDCSNIFEAIGGPATSSSKVKQTLNGLSASGYTCSGAPLSHSCDDSKKCGYVVRNDLTKKAVPSGAGFASFQSIVSSSQDYATFLEGIQFGLHNEVHNAVGGVMSTFASPRDVFFFSWHSAIDMYLYTYHLCKIGVPLTEEEFQASLEAFAKASQTCGGVKGVDGDSKVIMNVKVNGVLMDATQHPTFGKYFAEVGDEMWNYGNPMQLGDYSYTYELPDILSTQLLSNSDMCKGFAKVQETPAPTPSPTPEVSSASASASVSASGSNAVSNSASSSASASASKSVSASQSASAASSASKSASASSSASASAATSASSSVATSTSASSASASASSATSDSGNDSGYVSSYGQNDNGYGQNSAASTFASSSGSEVDASASTGYNAYTGDYDAFVDSGIKNETHSGIIVSVDSTGVSVGDDSSSVVAGSSSFSSETSTSVATSGDYWVWLKTTYDGLVTRFDGNMDLVAQQMQIIECQAFDSVFGVTTFTEDFVSNFHLASSRPLCGKKLDAVASGDITVAANTTSFSASTVTFASTEVVKTVISEYKPSTESSEPLIDPSYVHKAQQGFTAALEEAAKPTEIKSQDAPKPKLRKDCAMY